MYIHKAIFWRTEEDRMNSRYEAGLAFSKYPDSLNDIEFIVDINGDKLKTLPWDYKVCPIVDVVCEIT